jgi:hypothetical protein
MFIPIRPRQPNDPPPPTFRVQLMYLGAFLAIFVAITGVALYLGGRPIY